MYVYIYNIHDFPCRHATSSLLRQSTRSGATPLVQFDVDLLVRVPVHMWCTSTQRFFFPRFFFWGGVCNFVCEPFTCLPNWDSIGNTIKTSMVFFESLWLFQPDYVVYLGLSPLPGCNRGKWRFIYRDPRILKIFHNPGGSWNPGRGPQPNVYAIFGDIAPRISSETQEACFAHSHNKNVPMFGALTLLFVQGDVLRILPVGKSPLFATIWGIFFIFSNHRTNLSKTGSFPGFIEGARVVEPGNRLLVSSGWSACFYLRYCICHLQDMTFHEILEILIGSWRDPWYNKIQSMQQISRVFDHCSSENPFQMGGFLVFLKFRETFSETISLLVVFKPCFLFSTKISPVLDRKNTKISQFLNSQNLPQGSLSSPFSSCHWRSVTSGISVDL